jgi:putative FmdB family regulatory protein
MSLLLFDFECIKCNHRHEKLVKSDVRVQDCPECGAQSYRVISPVRCKLDATSGDFPGATIKWEKQHEKAGRQS